MKTRKFGYFVKRFFLVLLIFVLGYCIWQYELVFYGISQGIGQMKIIVGAKPIEEVYQDPLFPDSLKKKIRLVQEIRKFAFDSLGLKRNENYTTVYDQGNEPILWVLTACEPFQLAAKEWSFPLIGDFSYKGFFKLKKAEKEEAELIRQGYDTSVDEVGGWSTLGWFKDPILTEMLDRSEGQLANLIIHELTHGTLYVKNNVDFNENLASFVGDKGALKFLAWKYGADSEQYKRYKRSRVAAKHYTALVLNYAIRFDSLYGSFKSRDSKKIKLHAKQELFKEFENKLQVLSDSFSTKGIRRFKIEHLNNTYLMDVKRYRKSLDVFEEEFQNRFNSDFNKYMAYLKVKYPSL